MLLGCYQVYFNSRPSARGDVEATPAAGAPPISIHAPPRGATDSFKCAVHDVLYFNSRPSARGDCKLARWLSAEIISIHAPPRGATYKLGRKSNEQAISIHAPPRGATHHATCKARKECYFNSRPSARGDTRARRCRRRMRFQFTPLREGRLAELVRALS